MTPILTTSCHNCNPKWKAVGKSYGTYICRRCGKTFNQILEKTKTEINNENFGLQTKTT